MIDLRRKYETLTMAEKRELHRAVWLELAESGSIDKESTAVVQAYPKLRNNCVCCQEFLDYDDKTNTCDKCPIKWGGDPDTEESQAARFGSGPNAFACEWTGALYYEWDDVLDDEERKRFAKLIAEAWPEDKV